ncbi:hypothetical protein E7W39_10410 [Cronobacter sakazakii]|uniref:hypothetical protein n=1 Tax=Cronobacter sakazakii TaxID=28141 RepID=UPI001F505139|nr:hypothetical protein [Cronobacter sakazakii]EIX1654016.1 hypothetical protein [Cronobacter sakazakii]EIX1762651.1 hypothetical protein [Cronobacter sakazakii]EIX6119814.1 hypothetical protein [Cronobacter sakazakii]EIX6209471.1 hypothetical protein [Cronobacter sakazakii]EJO9052836.1 hypothetical protein [Cronobacter sakazakii]
MDKRAMDLRAHTERLERVILDGVELRDQMRKKMETQASVIAAQMRDLDAAISAKELFRERRKRISVKLCAAQGEVKRYKAKYEKLLRQQEQSQRFVDTLRRMLSEAGMGDIFSKAREEMRSEKTNV